MNTQALKVRLEVMNPCMPERCTHAPLKSSQTRDHVIRGCRLIARRVVDKLTGTSRIVGGIALFYSVVEECSCIRIDHYCSPSLDVVYSFSDVQWIVIKIHRLPQCVGWDDAACCSHGVDCLNDERSDERIRLSVWCYLSIEINDDDL